MNITVSEKTAEQVQKLINDGAYPDADAAIQDAIRILADLRDRERLWESFIEADRSIDEGLGQSWNELAWDTLWNSSKAKARSGYRPDSDVTGEP